MWVIWRSRNTIYGRWASGVYAGNYHYCSVGMQGQRPWHIWEWLPGIRAHIEALWISSLYAGCERDKWSRIHEGLPLWYKARTLVIRTSGLHNERSLTPDKKLYNQWSWMRSKLKGNWEWLYHDGRGKHAHEILLPRVESSPITNVFIQIYHPKDERTSARVWV